MEKRYRNKIIIIIIMSGEMEGRNDDLGASLEGSEL